jgi:starch-binding outer membrane protein, SusD/RagB family
VSLCSVTMSQQQLQLQYVDMYEGFATGSATGTLALTGLSADELRYYPGYELFFTQFYENDLTSDNTYVLGLWSSIYKSIYQANAVLEGLSTSTGVTAAVNDQLRGEALFVRAFSHLHAVNLFGDVPLVLTTDYRTNAVVSRNASSEVYSQIIADLIEAQSLLSDTYFTAFPDERVRPNKGAATALLARVYLYTGEWANAEAQATSVIDNNSIYSLADINSVFLTYSMEAIWQLRPQVFDGNGRTYEAQYFNTFFLDYNVLNEQLVNAFEPDDARLVNWVGSFDTGSEIVYYPFKYKQVNQDTPPEEFSMVLRLAEQYLIRAEARAKQDNLNGAIADIDVIRSRAALPLIQDVNPTISKEDLLTAIIHERQVELFTEGGHRWFDLKRTALADNVLAPVKAGWVATDKLYQIPQNEISNNPQLGDQNPGY